MKVYWALLLTYLYVKSGELSNLKRKFNNDPSERTKLFRNLNNIQILILRDVKLASVPAKWRNPLRDNGITSARSMVRALDHLAQGNLNNMLDLILKYNKVEILSLSVAEREMTAREYRNAQVFVDIIERVHAIDRSKRIIKGKHLIATARQQKPSIYFNLKNDSKTVINLAGDTAEVIELLKYSLGFTYTVIPSFEPAIIVNGSWTGTIGMLARKEVDINLLPYNYEEDKHSVVDFCVALPGGSFTIMIPYPKEIRSLLASTWPFKPTVWLCLFVTMVAITLTLSIAAVIRSKNKPVLLAISESSMYAYGLITCQGLDCPGRTHKSRLVAGMWGMVALLFVYSYNSQLTSYLTIPQLKPQVNSMNELAHSKALEVTVMPGSNIGLELLAATSGTYGILGDRIRSNSKENFAKNIEDAVNKVASGRFAFLTNDYSATYWGNVLFQKTRTCSVMLVNQPLSYIHTTITLQKGSVYQPAINYKLLDILKSGLTVYITRHSGKGLPRFRDYCKVPIKDIPTNVILTLSQLQSAFAVLGIGLLAAFVSLLCELTMSKFHYRYRYSL